MGLFYGAQCDMFTCDNAHIFRWDKSANKGKVQAELRKSGWTFGATTICAECNEKHRLAKEAEENA